MKEEFRLSAELITGAVSLTSATAWLTWFIAAQFSKVRALMHDELRKRDRAIRRLEFWAIRHGVGDNGAYQPGIDPPALREAGIIFGDEG